MPDLLDKGGSGHFSQFLGQGFAFFFEAFETDFYQLVALEEVFKFCQKFWRCPGFAKFEGRFEKLGSAFEFAQGGFRLWHEWFSYGVRANFCV